eukprot:TRINITY_DN34074_c0_g1_i1.p1 TRINITY_DN34074_c0_g1~~TRINITY_DN34074_c0_g1_i1.p1  ORF type:complete len:417 (-),score=94.60 TRINITY_DN34074_c0_g1_i1:28-1278(-)
MTEELAIPEVDEIDDEDDDFCLQDGPVSMPVMPAPRSKAAKMGDLTSRPAWEVEEDDPKSPEKLKGEGTSKQSNRKKSKAGSPERKPAQRKRRNKPHTTGELHRPSSAPGTRLTAARPVSAELRRRSADCQPPGPARAVGSRRPASAPSGGRLSRPSSAGAVRPGQSRPTSASRCSHARVPQSWHALETAKVNVATVMNRCELLQGVRLRHGHAMAVQDEALRYSIMHRGSPQQLQQVLRQRTPQVVQQLREQCDAMRESRTAVAQFRRVGRWVHYQEQRYMGKENADVARRSSISALEASGGMGKDISRQLEGGLDVQAELADILGRHQVSLSVPDTNRKLEMADASAAMQPLADTVEVEVKGNSAFTLAQHHEGVDLQGEVPEEGAEKEFAEPGDAADEPDGAEERRESDQEHE